MSVREYPRRRAVVSGLLVIVCVAVLSIPLAAVAQQKAVGSIYGNAQPAPNQTVTVEDVGTGSTRTVTVTPNGEFTIRALQPGTYKATLLTNGVVVATRTGVVVNGGLGSAVDFVSQQVTKLAAVQVTGVAITPIDVTTTSTVQTLLAPEMLKLPVARNILSVATLAPTVNPSPGFNIPSFGGASSAENAFYVNGMNVTDDFVMLALAQPPFETLQSVQTMTGGIGAAYGNALGGVVNMTTKTGTNQFHAGVDAYWNPRGLAEQAPNVYLYGSNGLPTTLVIRNNMNYNDSLKYDVWGSGPIVPNRLFFYAFLQENNNSTGYSSGYSTNIFDEESGNNPYGLVNLTYNINDQNTFTLTGWRTKQTTDGTEYNLVTTPGPGKSLADATFGAVNGGYVYNEGNRALIGRYSWVPNQHFNLSGMMGYVRFDRGVNSSQPDCPAATDDRVSPPAHLGCWVTGARNLTPGVSDYRHEYRIDGEWVPGSGEAGLLSGHDISFGYAYDSFLVNSFSAPPGPLFKGLPGVDYTYRTVPSNGVVNGVCWPTGAAAGASGCPIPPAGASYVTAGQTTQAGFFGTINRAFYIEDHWHIFPNWRANIGVRNTGYTSKNAAGTPFLSESNQWAPRLGFAWDVRGNSTLKVYGSYSQYFIPISVDTNISYAGAQTSQDFTYAFKGIDPATGTPLNLTQLGLPRIQSAGTTAPPVDRIAATNLKPMSEKELIFGMQNKFSDNWTFGLEGTHRWLVDDQDDTCSLYSLPPLKPDLADLARKEGWDVQSFLNTVAPEGCMILNPGYPIDTYADINGSGKLSPIVIPNSYLQLPKGKRIYNALIISLTRNFTNRWLMGASLTLSHLYGNTEGTVLSNGFPQGTAPLGEGNNTDFTPAFDTPGAEEGDYGPLDNDHPVVLKAWGSFEFLPNWTVGGNAVIAEGAPLSCFGTYPNDDSLTGGGSHWCGGQPGGAATFPNGAVLIPQGSAGRLPWAYNLNLQLSWTPQKLPGLTLTAQWFNVLGSEAIETVNETSDNGIGIPNPLYLTAQSFQLPSYWLFSARYEFF